MVLFPESTRVVFEKNPLVDVICQLRFPTILSIRAREPADFQDRLRHEYPEYERDRAPVPPQLPKELASLFSDLPLPPVGGDSAPHRFKSEDAKRQIVLANSFLAVSDEDYERWETFKAAIDLAQAALEDIYEPSFYSRTGLRYINVIDREHLDLDDEPWSSLLSTSLLGALGDPNMQDKVEETTTQTQFRVEAPDIPEETFVTLRHGLINEEDEDGRQTYRIDVDFFTKAHLKGGDVGAVLDFFNRQVGNLFRFAVTDVLHQALGATPIED